MTKFGSAIDEQCSKWTLGEYVSHCSLVEFDGTIPGQNFHIPVAIFCNVKDWAVQGLKLYRVYHLSVYMGMEQLMGDLAGALVQAPSPSFAIYAYDLLDSLGGNPKA